MMKESDNYQVRPKVEYHILGQPYVVPSELVEIVSNGLSRVGQRIRTHLETVSNALFLYLLTRHANKNRHLQAHDFVLARPNSLSGC